MIIGNEGGNTMSEKWLDKAVEYDEATPSLKKKAKQRIPKLEEDIAKYKKILEKPTKRK